MIQILGLREFVTKDTKEVKLYDSHFANGWRVNSVAELFNNIETYVEQIPEEQRWNMFYTTSSCLEEKGRKFISQDVLPIDIDGMNPEEAEQVADCVLKELDLDREKVGIVASGNGVHLLIGLTRPIEDVSYFKSHRVYYRALCGRINTSLFQNGLRGSADPSVFSAARLLRLPLTINKKKSKEDSECRLLQPTITPIDVDLISLSELPRLQEGDHIHPRAFTRFPDPDTKAVQEGCSFLQHCYNKQEEITEPEWYAMISIIGRLENGDQLVHQYSEQHELYSAQNTDEKLSHALEAAGPRTCENISSYHDGCRECPHFNKITSPIQIVGEDYIRTLETGFYDVVIKNGAATRGKPNYDDLVKHFENHNKYFTLEDSQMTFVHVGTHWVEMPKLRMHSFAEENFDPSPSNSMCVEFETKVRRSNLKPADFTNTQGFLNFQNGILNLDDFSMQEHSTDFGFTYVIPYDYESGDECPLFDKFMDDVTIKDLALQKVLLEYMGYCISGTDPKLVQMCAILHGGGGNGKSVLLDVLRNLVGPANCSAVGMKNIAKDTGRFPMMGRAINISDETPTNGFLESSDFKAVVSGDTLEVRRLYHNPMEWKCTTKLVFACNELPHIGDFSDGLFRRLLIIPFKARFSRELGNLDPMILDKLMEERSGILNKILRAFVAFRDGGYRFTEAEAVSDAKDEYEETGDNVLQFTNEMCEGDASVTMEMDTRTIYRCYAAWCDDNRIRFCGYGSFAKRFGKHIKRSWAEVETKRKKVGASKITLYTGLKIHATQEHI